MKLLEEAGAVMVGKTYTVEFASGLLYNPQYRPEITMNPWGQEKRNWRQPGGSSSGRKRHHGPVRVARQGEASARPDRRGPQPGAHGEVPRHGSSQAAQPGKLR